MSQAPEDGCTNIRNMLSSSEIIKQVTSSWSIFIQLMYLPSSQIHYLLNKLHVFRITQVYSMNQIDLTRMQHVQACTLGPPRAFER
jgi:hypothetical protein